MSKAILLRAPTSCSSSASSGSSCTFLTIAELISSPWKILYSTLPLWKDKRNVHIRYASLAPNRLDDTVMYQTLAAGSKVKTICGIDTAAVGNTASSTAGGEWDWRGKGWLRIASSHWEVLGCGDVEEGEGGKWCVIFFEKTLFTPAGVDVLAQGRTKSLAEGVVARIKSALAESEDARVRKLVEGLFAVRQDDLDGACG